MIIKIKERKINKHESSYKVIDIKSCCEDLIECDSLSLNNEDDDFTEGRSYSVKIVETQVNNDPYEYYPPTYFYKTISYCPFCGNKITVEIVETEDLTEEYKKLEKESRRLHSKRNKTDSKKEEQECNARIREIDKKIRELHYSDTLDLNDIEYDKLYDGLE